MLTGGRVENAGQQESDAVERLLKNVTAFLEGLAGTTAEALGLGSYMSRPDAGQSAAEIANAVLKRAAAGG